MNKPITMIIKETKNKLANICNESGLPPVILDLIMHDIYSEIHSIVEKQTLEDESAYAKAMEESYKNADVNEK